MNDHALCSRVVCSDCGTFDQDIKVGASRQCGVCGSGNLFFELSDILIDTHDIGHPPFPKEFTGKPSALTRVNSALLEFVFLRRVREFFQSHPRKVREAPGATILQIADFLFSPAAVEKVFKQLVADWRLEYCEALRGDRYWKARWICCRYYWAIAKAGSLDKLVSWFDRVLRRI